MGAGESETTQLPDGLQKFFKVTLGMEWPEGSEGGLRAMSAAWSDFSEALAEAGASVSRASGGFDRAMDGKYAAAVVDNLTTKTLPALDEMMAAADDFASSTKNAAADIQKAKIMLISMAAITLATVISLLASLFGAFLVPAVEAAAQVGMRTLISQLIARLGSLTARGVSQAALQSVKSITWKGAGKAALNVAKYPAGGAAIMGGLDLSIQAGQNAAGTRDGIDWDSVGNMAIGGAIGGAGFGAFHGGANAFLKFLPNAGKASPLANAIGHAAYAGGQVLTVGATNPLVNLATGGDDEWWAGMLGGASSYQGSATGGSGHHTRDLIGHVFPSTKPVFEFVNKATSPSYLLGRNGPFAKQLYGKGNDPSTEDGANEPLLSDPPSGEDVVIPGDEDSSYDGGADLGGDRGGVDGSGGRDVVGADGRSLGTVFDNGGGDRITTESAGRGVTLGGPEQVVSTGPSTTAGNGDPATFDSTADAPEATGGSAATPRAAATGGESSESGPVGLRQDGQGDSSNGSQQTAHEASGGRQQSNDGGPNTQKSTSSHADGGVSNGGESNGSVSNDGVSNGGESNGGVSNGGVSNSSESNSSESNSSESNSSRVDGSRAESGESSGSQANTQEPNGGRSSTNESVPTQRTLDDPGTSTSSDRPGESRSDPDGSEPQSIGSGGRSEPDSTGTDPAAFDRTGGSGENASTHGPATSPSTTERSSEGPAEAVQNGQNSSAGQVDTSQPSPSTSGQTSTVATPPSGQATPQPATPPPATPPPATTPLATTPLATTPQPAPSTSPQPAAQSNAQPAAPATTSQSSTSPPASTPSGGTQSSIPQTTSAQPAGSQATSSQSGPTSQAGQSTTTPPTTSQQPATQSSGNATPSTNQPGQTSTPSTQPPAGESARPTAIQTPSGKPAPQLDTVTAQSQSSKPAVPAAPPNSPVTPTTPTGATTNAPPSEPPKPVGQTSPSQPPPAAGPQSSPATPKPSTPPPPPPNTPTSPAAESSAPQAKPATPPPAPPNTPTSQAATPPPSESPAKSATPQTPPAKPAAPVEPSTPQGQPPKPATPAATQSSSETAGPPAKNSSTSTATTPPQQPKTPESSAPPQSGGHQQTSHAGTEQVAKGKGKAKVEDTAGVIYQPPQPPGTGRNDTGRSEPDGSRGDEPAPFVVPSRDWHAARDRAPVERFSTERRTTANRSGGSHITQVRFDSRRFQARPGAWVRELTVPVELTSRTGEVSPHERRELADELQRQLDEHVNQRYRFAGGDQLHVSVDARTSSSPSRSWTSNRADSVQVDVFDGTKSGGGRAEGQLAWDAQAAPGRQVRNALSFLGVQGRAGVSGPGTPVPRLTRENLHQIAHVLADPNAAPPANTPAPRRNDARQEVVSHGPRDTPPPPDRTPPPGGGPRPSNRSRRLEPVPEEYELTEFRRTEESTRDTLPGGEPETVSTAALPHETLPDYLRQNRAGGPSKQVAAANGIDIVTGLAEIDRRLADDRTVRTLQTEVAQQTLSFLGNGKRRTVMVDGVPHELSVRAEFDWQALTVRPGKVDPDGTPTADGPARQEPDQPKHSSESSATSSTGTSASRNRDVNLNARATVMPPLVATAKVNMPGGPNTEQSTTTTFDAKRSTEAKGGALTRVDVPVRVHYELSGPAGRGPRQSDGTAELDVPTSYRNTAEGTARAPRTLPSRFAVEAAYSEPGRRGDFAEQAWRDLPEHLTELQSDGRRALRELFDDGNLAERLPDMAVVDPAANEGWISSEVLSKGADSKRWRDPKDRLEIRAVARDVQLLETVGDVTHTDTFSGKTGSSSASNTQRGVGGNVHVGAGADTGVVFWSAGPVVGASGTRTKSFEDTTASNTKDVVTVNGDASRYKVTYDVEVRRAGHGATTLDGALHAVQWSRRDRAERAGLYDPDPPSADTTNVDTTNGDTTNGDTTNTGAARREAAAPEREVYAPPHLEYGDSVGGSVVDDFAGGDRLRETITAALRDLPGRKWYHLSTKAFLRSFDAPELRGLSSRANEILARGDDLAAHLSDAELAQLVDTMLGPKGLTFEITKKGVFWDFHTTVNLRGDLGPLRDEVTDTAATTGGKRKDRSSTSYEASRKIDGQFGVAGRVSGPLGTTAGAYWASVDGGHGRTRGTSFGSAHQESVATTESARTKRDDATLEGQPMRAFLGDLRITPSTQSWVTPTTSTRRFTVGSPGRTAPALVPDGTAPRGRLDPHTVPLRLLVPENLTSRTLGDRDSAHRGDVTELAEPPSIRTLPRADRVFDNADVVAVRGTEHLADAIRRVLGRASDDDPIFRPQRADDGSPRTATLFTDEIEGRFGPDRLADDPRLFSRPQTTRVNWLRRRADTSAAAAVALTPRSVTPLTPREYGTIKRTRGNTSSVGGSHGHNTTLSSRHDAFDTQHAPASGTTRFSHLLGIGGTPWAKRWGTKHDAGAEAVRKTTFENGKPVSRTLVRVGVDATVVGEVKRTGNLDRWELTGGDGTRTAGESFRIDDAVVLWATDEQLAALERAAERTEPHTTPEGTAPERREVHEPSTTDGRRDGETTGTNEPRLPAPDSVRAATKPSLGIGGVSSRVDLSSRIDELHDRLVESLGGETAGRLLPKAGSALDDPHDNHGRAAAFLSDVDRSADRALNGGELAPLRLEDRLTGHTYYLGMDARFVGEPRFLGIEHPDKVSVEQSAAVSNTTERSSGRTAAELGLLHRFGPRFFGEKAAGSQQAMGAPLVGSMGGAELGKRDATNTTGDKSEHTQSISATGPMASYRGTVRFDLRIERGLTTDAQGHETAGSVVARDTVSVPDVDFLTLPGDSFPAPRDGSLGSSGDIRPVPRDEHSPSSTDAWRSDGDHALPRTGDLAAEHYFGDIGALRETAGRALTESGIGHLDARTVAALKNGITTSMVKAGIEPMANGDFVLPLPHLGRELEVHVRPSAPPRLATVDANVELEGSRKNTHEASTELRTGTDYRVTATVPAPRAGTTSTATQPRHFDQGTGGFNYNRNLLSRSDQVTATGGRGTSTDTDPVSADQRRTDDRVTRVDLQDVEFRFVARSTSGSRTGAAELAVSDAYALRSNPDPANPLPRELVDSATRLKDAGRTWHDAVRKHDGHSLNAGPRPHDRDTAEGLNDVERRARDAEAAWWRELRAHRELVDAARAAQEAPGRRGLEIEPGERPGPRPGGTHGDPTPLHRLVDDLDPSDVDVTRLVDDRGGTAGVFFGRGADAEVLRESFRRGAGRDDTFTVAAHHNADGFAIPRRSTGETVRVSERGLARLIEAMDPTATGRDWRQAPNLLLLSCRVADGALTGSGSRLAALDPLLRDAGYHGRLLGPDTPVRAYESGRVEVADGGGLRTPDGTPVTPEAEPRATGRDGTPGHDHGRHVELSPGRGPVPPGPPLTTAELTRFTESWLDARIEYERQGQAYEQRLGEYLARHPKVDAELTKVYRAMIDLLPRRERNHIGEGDPEIPGAVGTGNTYQVLRDGTPREKMTMLWSVARDERFARHLGGLPERNPVIERERYQRRMTEAEQRYQEALRNRTLSDAAWETAVEAAADALRSHQDPDTVRPPMSGRELDRNVRDGRLQWMPASNRMDLSVGPVAGQHADRGDASLHRESELAGGRVTTGTSGSTYLVMKLAQEIERRSGIEVDWPLLRAAFLAHMLPTGIHTYHEVMRAAELLDPRLGYTDDWGRYRALEPFTEQELRDNVAVDGRFPDEHAVDRAAWPEPAADRQPTMATLARRLEELDSFFDSSDAESASSPRSTWSDPFDLDDALPPSDPPPRRRPPQPEPDEAFADFSGVHREPSPDRPDEPALELTEEQLWEPEDATTPERVTTVPFEQRHHALSSAGQRAVRTLGLGMFREFLRQHRAGEPFTRVSVVGYGNSRTHGRQTGLARAEAVRGALLDVLGGERERAARFGVDLPAFTDQHVSVFSAGRADEPRTTGEGVAERRRAAAVHLHGLPPLGAAVELGGGTLADPAPLHELVDGPLDLSDVDYAPLRDESGRTVGVAFPRSGEGDTLRAAFEHGASRDGAYTVAAHHNADGFAVRRRSDGAEVRIDEHGMRRLLDSTSLPGGQAWRQGAELVFLSCRVADAGIANRLGALADLLRGDGYRGDVLGPAGKATVYESGRVDYSGEGTRAGLRRADGSPAPETTPDGVRPAGGAHVDLQPGRRERVDGDETGQGPRRHEVNRFNRSWLDARIEYERQSAAFERRLGEYLAGHPDVTRTVDSLYEAMLDQLPPAARALAGETEPTVAGAVGQGARATNLREKLTAIWSIGRRSHLAQSLGELPGRHPEIENERHQRRSTEAEEAYQRALEDTSLTGARDEDAVARATGALRSDVDPDSVRPPLSDRERERAVADDGGLRWLPADKRKELSVDRVDGQPENRDGSLHRASEPTGGRVSTGTSGSTYLLLRLARRISDNAGLQLDMNLVRAAIVSQLVPTGMHTFHEVMRAAELADETLRYQDDWGRYRSLAPFGEQELRDNVAVDGRFPDEHALERVSWPSDAGTPLRSREPFTLSDVLPERLWWRLFLEPGDHPAAALAEDPATLYDHPGAGTGQGMPGLSRGVLDAYREFLDTPGAGRLTSAEYKRMHETVTRHLEKPPDWSGRKTTNFPVRADRVHPEVLAERVGGRPLAADPRDPGFSLRDDRPLTVVNSWRGDGPAVLSTAYRQGEAPGIADAIFEAYYDELARALSDRERLEAIGRAVRNLYVAQLFEDANSRVTRKLVLPKLLLENGFLPVVHPDMRTLFQGGSAVAHIADVLEAGQRSGLGREAVDLAREEFEQARREYDRAVNDRLAVGDGDPARAGERVEAAMDRLTRAIERITALDTPNAEEPSVTLGDPDDAPGSPVSPPPREPEDGTVFDTLVDLSNQADERPVPPLPDTGGVFGTPGPRPRPSGVDPLPDGTGERAAGLDGLDLTRDPSLHPGTEAGRAPSEPPQVERHEPGERRYTWAGADRHRLPPLPAVLELPRLVHSVWLSGALRSAETVGAFRANLERTLHAAGEGWKAVVWTDISRERFLDAVLGALPERPPLSRLVPVRHGDDEDDDRVPPGHLAELLDWARSGNVTLVNVDEVFHDDEPMELRDSYDDELARGDDEGLDNAVDILGNEILDRFGGVSIRPDRYATELDSALDAPRGDTGWGLGDGAAVVPRGHPVTDAYREHLRDRLDHANPYAAPQARQAPAVPVSLPLLDGFVPGEAPAVALDAPAASLSVAEGAKRAIDVLVRKLVATGGELDLAGVARLIEGGEQAPEVWTVVLGFLATHPEYADLVHGVTIGSFDERGLPVSVPLPAKAAELIAFTEGPRSPGGPGVDTRAATLTWPEWL